MAFDNAFYKLKTLLRLGPLDEAILDFITEGNPMLETMPFKASTSGVLNQQRIYTDADIADTVDFNGNLPIISADREIEIINLTPRGGIVIAPEMTLAQMRMSFMDFFIQELSVITPKSGNALEKDLFYNTFRKKADEVTNIFDAGGTGNDLYSVVAVNWSLGNSGLYNADGFEDGQGMLFDTAELNGGLHNLSVHGASYTGTGYAARLLSYIGVQLSNAKKGIAAISNIDLADENATITEKLMDNLVRTARKSPNTIIYMPPEVKDALDNLASDKVRIAPESSDFRADISLYKGMRIVETYNTNGGSETRLETTFKPTV